MNIFKSWNFVEDTPSQVSQMADAHPQNLKKLILGKTKPHESPTLIRIQTTRKIWDFICVRKIEINVGFENVRWNCGVSYNETMIFQ